ncbi:MAG: TetR/AcrR family transcriptional regulator [Microbacteriaceae bacterium]
MPKVIDHDQRRSYIIDVAWGLIMKGGIEAATMREIAAEAGFANGALKHYFPGKDEIIHGAYQRALSAMNEHVTAAIADKTGMEALRTFVETTLPVDEDAESAARVLLSFWEHGIGNDALRTAYHEHLESWRATLVTLIEDARAEGTVRTTKSDEELVDEIILVNIGATVLAVTGPQFVRPESLRRLAASFFEGL